MFTYYHWGKLLEDTSKDISTTVQRHCFDAAVVAFVLIENNKQIQEAIKTLIKTESYMEENNYTYEDVIATILFLIALHDLGKIDYRFQFSTKNDSSGVVTKRRIIKNTSYCQNQYSNYSDMFDADEVDKHLNVKYYHGNGTYYWFKDEKPNYISDDFVKLVEFVAKHHGFNPKDCSDIPHKGTLSRLTKNLQKADKLSRKETIDFFYNFFIASKNRKLIDFNIGNNDIFCELIAGLCTKSDCLSSALCEFKNEPLTENLFNNCVKYIEKELDRIGINILQPIINKINKFDDIYNGLTPRGIQKLWNEIKIEKSGLYLIEGSTGCGKTELMLLLAFLSILANHANGLCFALPTIATSNSIFNRIIENKLLEKFFNEEDIYKIITLCHGTFKYNDHMKKIYNTIKDKPGYKTYDDFNCKSTKRCLGRQVSVCTVDQIIMSWIKSSKHYFQRFYETIGKVLIIDEFHSYDSYMTSILLNVIKNHIECGGIVICASATMPKKIKNKIKRKLLGDSFEHKFENKKYPLITHFDVCNKKINEREGEEEFSKKVYIKKMTTNNMLPNKKMLIDCINKAKNGEKIGMFFNTKIDCIITCKKINELLNEMHEDIDVSILHANFTINDRLKKEKDCLEKYKTNAANEEGGILFGTQVIEQSLDLDFDFIITQLCPIDDFFQRLGRLARLISKMQNGKKYECVVLMPEQWNTKNNSHMYVYDDISCMERTKYRLNKEDEFEITTPKDYREYIDFCYNEEIDDLETKLLEDKNYKEKKDKYIEKVSKQEDVAYWATQNSSQSIEDDECYGTRYNMNSKRVILAQKINNKLYSLDGKICFQDEFNRNKFEFYDEIQNHSISLPLYEIYEKDFKEQVKQQFFVDENKNIYLIMENKENFHVDICGVFVYDCFYGLYNTSKVNKKTIGE